MDAVIREDYLWWLCEGVDRLGCIMCLPCSQVLLDSLLAGVCFLSTARLDQHPPPLRGPGTQPTVGDDRGYNSQRGHHS